MYKQQQFSRQLRKAMSKTINENGRLKAQYEHFRMPLLHLPPSLLALFFPNMHVEGATKKDEGSFFIKMERIYIYVYIHIYAGCFFLAKKR